LEHVKPIAVRRSFFSYRAHQAQSGLAGIRHPIITAGVCAKSLRDNWKRSPRRTLDPARFMRGGASPERRYAMTVSVSRSPHDRGNARRIGLDLFGRPMRPCACNRRAPSAPARKTRVGASSPSRARCPWAAGIWIGCGRRTLGFAAPDHSGVGEPLRGVLASATTMLQDASMVAHPDIDVAVRAHPIGACYPGAGAETSITL